MRSYDQLLADEKIRNGMSPQQARRNARIELGGIEQVKEQVREARPGHLLEAFWRDLRITFRGLRKKPGFTIVVVLSLALGIGANAAIFSLIDAIVFRPMPVPYAGEVIAIDTAASKLTRYGGSSYLDYVDFCARAKSFKSLAIAQQMSAGMNAATAAPGSKPENIAWLARIGEFLLRPRSATDPWPRLSSRRRPGSRKIPGRGDQLFPVEPRVRERSRRRWKNHQAQWSQLHDRRRRSKIIHRHRPVLPPRHFRSHSHERPSNSGRRRHA